MFIKNVALVSAFALTNFVFAQRPKITSPIYHDTDKHYIDINIGTDSGTFHVALDTNSSFLWVNGIECPDSFCGQARFHNRGHLKSASYRNKESPLEQYYSYDATHDQSYVAGILGTDQVTICGLTVEQDFSPVFENFKVFKEFDKEKVYPEYAPGGVLGLAMNLEINTRAFQVVKSKPAPRPYSSLLYTLAAKGLIDKTFSIYLGKETERGLTSGEFVLNGLSPEKIKQPPRYLAVVPSGIPQFFPWQVSGQEFKVSMAGSTAINEKVITTFTSSDADHQVVVTKTEFTTQQKPPTVLYQERFDSAGNNLFRFATASPISMLKKEYNDRLFKALIGREPSDKEKMSENVKGSYVVECSWGKDHTKKLSITFPDVNGKPLEVTFPLAHLVIQNYDKNNAEDGCIWGPQNTEKDTDPMYLGQDILRHVYMTFDFEAGRIGLSAPSNSDTEIIAHD